MSELSRDVFSRRGFLLLGGAAAGLGVLYAIARNRQRVRALDPEAIGPVRTTPAPCADVLDVLPELREMARTTVRLHPRRLANGQSLPRSASKMGGEFLWPADEPWPHCEMHEIPWVGVLQLRKDEFPEIEFKVGTDLLQVLWCPQRGHGRYINPEPVVVWRSSAQISSALQTIPTPRLPTAAEEREGWRQSALEHDLHWLEMFDSHPEYMRETIRAFGGMPRPSSDTWLPARFLQLPAETDEQYEALRAAARKLAVDLQKEHRIPKYADENFLPHPCRLFPERVTEYPRELADEQMARLSALPAPNSRTGDHEDFASVYWSELSVADGMKVGGYVLWSQVPEEPRCERGHLMEHLLTIASAEWDGANWPRWRAVEDAELYERLRASGEYDAAAAIHRAAGLSLGDMASKYVFICRQCEEWPVRSIIQD